MGVLDVKELGGKEKGSRMKNVTTSCSKSCVECLGCSHNKNSQFSLLLATLFNKGINLSDKKGRDVNGLCNL